MDSQLWEHVREAFHRLSAVSPAERDKALAKLPEQARLQVADLLAADSAAGDFLEPAPAHLPPGAAVGAYVVDALVAQGGMGEVYRGHRESDFERPVAIKILGPLFALRDAERLFERERQILARLSHPNIVGLLDGGITGGRPFFVMEWVEGRSLDEWARGRSLDDRLALFEQICAAAHAAHQNLIAHCDLKPSNVLVTEQGAAKLLDFGIARVLDLTGGLPAATRATLRILTLSYASPEQARGLPAGIASDVYSLGLLLYELAAGQPAQPVDGLPVDEAIAHIADAELARPPGVAKDLYALIRKAAAKDPARRYTSAAALAEDVQRFRSGHAVRAEGPSWSYRAGKFARRHRAALLAAAAGLILALAALAGFAVQFRDARHQRAVAQRRFESARKLAQLMVFDAPVKLAGVPGTLEYRSWAAERAAGYLAELAADVDGDEVLAVSVARSFRRVAFEYFNTSAPNLNSPEKSLENLERGAAVLQTLRRPGPAVWVEWIENRLARPYTFLRRPEAAMDNEDRCAEAVERLAALGHPQVHQYRARVWFQQAANDSRPDAARLQLWGRLELYYAAELAKSPDDTERLRNLALVHKTISSFLTGRRRWDDSLEHDRKALALDQKRFVLQPTDSVRMDLSFDFGRLGQDLALAGRYEEGILEIRKAVAIRREFAARDAQDLRIQDRLAWSLGLLGRHLVASGALREAEACFREAIDLRRKYGLPGTGDNSLPDHYHFLAQILERTGRSREACEAWLLSARSLSAGWKPAKDEELSQDLIRRRAASCSAGM